MTEQKITNPERLFEPIYEVSGFKGIMIVLIIGSRNCVEIY